VSFLIRIANDYLKSEMSVITVILIVMGLFSLLTSALGVNTVLGAFVAGMLIGRSPILTRHIEEQLRGLIMALFLPVFFGIAGLKGKKQQRADHGLDNGSSVDMTALRKTENCREENPPNRVVQNRSGKKYLADTPMLKRAIPGLVLVTGIALTGGVGLLVAGPMIAGMSALGMGSLVDSLMGAASTNPDSAEKILDLPNTRIVRENESRTTGTSDLVAKREIDEQEVIERLGKVVEDAFESISKVSKLPVQEAMCSIEESDVAELKQATREAIKRISNATDLDRAQITDIFKTNRVAGINVIVNRLHEESKVNRARL
jgi:hypothetical protein